MLQVQSQQDSPVAGERYNLDRYYRSSFSFRIADVNLIEANTEKVEKTVQTLHGMSSFQENTTKEGMMQHGRCFVAGVDYAKYVEVKKATM